MDSIPMKVFFSDEDIEFGAKTAEAIVRNLEGINKSLAIIARAVGKTEAENPAQPEPARMSEPEPEQQEPAPVNAPSVTRDDIRQKVVHLSAAGQKEPVRTIVKAYANSVTDLPEAAFEDVWTRLCELEAG